MPAYNLQLDTAARVYVVYFEKIVSGVHFVHTPSSSIQEVLGSIFSFRLLHFTWNYCDCLAVAYGEVLNMWNGDSCG